MNTTSDSSMKKRAHNIGGVVDAARQCTVKLDCAADADAG